MAKSAYIARPIEGLGNLREVLRGLPLEVERKILADGVGAAARPVVRNAKRLAPKETGALRSSITSVVRRPRRKLQVYAIIGPSRDYYQTGTGQLRRPANYAHLVEFGHLKVEPKKGTSVRKKTATVTGMVAPRPFLGPALAAAAVECGDVMADGLRKGIERARARMVKFGVKSKS